MGHLMLRNMQDIRASLDRLTPEKVRQYDTCKDFVRHTATC